MIIEGKRFNPDEYWISLYKRNPWRSDPESHWPIWPDAGMSRIEPVRHWFLMLLLAITAYDIDVRKESQQQQGWKALVMPETHQKEVLKDLINQMMPELKTLDFTLLCIGRRGPEGPIATDGNSIAAVWQVPRDWWERL